MLPLLDRGNNGSTTNTSGEEPVEQDFEDVELTPPSATTIPNSSSAFASSNDARDSLIPAWVKKNETRYMRC